MADEAESLRRQINTLKGLIGNAEKTLSCIQKTAYKGCEIKTQHQGKEQYPGSSTQFQALAKSKKWYTRSRSNIHGYVEFSRKYSWSKTNTASAMPVFSGSNKVGTSKIQLQNRVLTANSDCDSSEQSVARSTTCNSKRIKDSAAGKSNIGSETLLKCDKSDLMRNTVLSKNRTDLNKNETGKQKTSSSSPLEFIRSVEVLKQAVERKEHQIKAREHTKQIQTKQKAVIAGNKIDTDTALLVSTSAGEGDKKVKSLSGSLKDELRKTEENIHLLKQTLLEKKSLIALKKNLTEPKGSLLEKQKLSAQVKQNQMSISQSQQLSSVNRSPKIKPVVRTLDLDSVPTNRDTPFISKSPYELFKSKTSPASASVTQKSNFDRSFKTHDRNFRTHKVKSKYWIRNVKSFQENKDLTENKTGMSLLNRMKSDLSVFKKTKYSLRRVQSVPGRNSQVNKVINNAGSHSQQTARFIKSKYKIHKTAPQRFFKRKKRYFTLERPWACPYRKQDWKLRKQSYAIQSRKFYQKSRKQWPQTAGYRYDGYGVWPYQQFYNVSRYMPPVYHTSRKHFSHRNRYSQTNRGHKFQQKRMKRKNEWKQVLFDPKLRTDHRPNKIGNLVMINGTVFRSTQSQLVKATSTGSSGLTKQGNMVKNSTRAVGRGSEVEIGVPSIQEKQGASVPAPSFTARVAAARLMNKSVATAVSKYKKDNSKSLKKKKYCMFYNRFGKCNRKDNCPFIHDPEKIAVCTRFLRGTCKVKDCPFSHKVSKEKMPVCSYFLRGKCNKDDCPYLHVNVSRDAEICEDFVDGFCPLGDECKKKHTLVCPVFAQTGSCPNGNKCKLQHRKTRKRKLTQSDNTSLHRKQVKQSDSSPFKVSSSSENEGTNTTDESGRLSSWTRIAPSKEKEPVILDSSGEESEDDNVPFKDKKLPTYISLSLKNPEMQSMIQDSSGTKEEISYKMTSDLRSSINKPSVRSASYEDKASVVDVTSSKPHKSEIRNTYHMPYAPDEKWCQQTV